jgi:hypothetical protein
MTAQLNMEIVSTYFQMTSSIWTQASCKGKDPELFFPETIARAQEAIEICESCPIKKICGAVAEGQRETTVGIWGGRIFDMEIEGKSGTTLRHALRNKCPQGHPYDSVRAVKQKDGQSMRVRSCSTCRRNWRGSRKAKEDVN